MKKVIWNLCAGASYIKKIATNAWRIVEAQHASSTRKLVDSIAEHEILEEMIDAVKPPLNDKLLKLNYLYFTPFRYPPLEYGSRFGTRFERSLWYGSLELASALAETAFYRFVFLRGSVATFDEVKTWHTAFVAPIKTSRGIDLTRPPFKNFKKEISSPSVYQISQQLGLNMRENNVHAFLYYSARDPNEGINIGIFEPEVFASKQPRANSFQTWECLTTDKTVEFVRASALQKEIKVFPIETFMQQGVLPIPAN